MSNSSHLSHQLNENTGCKLWTDYIYLPLFQYPEGFGTGALGGQGYQPGELLHPSSILLVPVGEMDSSTPIFISVEFIKEQRSGYRVTLDLILFIHPSKVKTYMR